MAESIVNKIKEKLAGVKLNLPFLKKKKVDEEEQEDPDYNKPKRKNDDVDINQTSSDATQPDKTNPNVKVSDLAEEGESAEEEKPKKESLLSKKIKVAGREIKVLHILVVVVGLYFAMDFMTQEEAPPEDAAPVETPKPKKKRKKKDEQAAQEGSAETSPTSEVANAESTPTTDSTPITLETTPEPATAEATPATETTPGPTVEASETPIVTDNTTSGEPNLNIEEINKESEAKDKEILAATPEPTAAPAPEEAPVASGETKEDKKEADIATDLLKNLTDSEDKEVKTSDADSSSSEVKETNAPNYEVLGRGLVYNCTDKHWACLSKDEYSICKMNRKWKEKSGSKKECQEISVYATEKDCQNAQKNKIDSLASTDFCN